jgi:hypothetical protein
MRTTLSSYDSSIGQKPIVSWKTFGNGWESLGWSSIPTRRAGSSSAGLADKTGSEEGKVSPRRSLSRRLHARQREERIRAILGAAHDIRKRMRAKLREVKQQLRKRMHDPMPQTRGLAQVSRARLLATAGNTGVMLNFAYYEVCSWRRERLRNGKYRFGSAERQTGTQQRTHPALE